MCRDVACRVLFVVVGCVRPWFFCFFFFNDTATTEIYTLSLHDALPICASQRRMAIALLLASGLTMAVAFVVYPHLMFRHGGRSEEHTSELQSQSNLVCRLLLGKKKKNQSMR